MYIYIYIARIQNIEAVFQNSLPILKIYSTRYINRRISTLTVKLILAQSEYFWRDLRKSICGRKFSESWKFGEIL